MSRGVRQPEICVPRGILIWGQVSRQTRGTPSCLRPGVPGVSDNIEVRAIIDRYLEHGRVFHFANAGKDEVYIASADWMPRNFHRRVEVMVPIEDPAIRGRLIDILAVQCQLLNDNNQYLAGGGGEGSQIRNGLHPGSGLHLLL